MTSRAAEMRRNWEASIQAQIATIGTNGTLCEICVSFLFY